jgi:nitrogen regulatory protein P-II 1
MRFKLIVAFIKPEITDNVVKVAKKAGATGDVIIQAKGSGLETTSFMGLSIQDKTNVVLFVVEEHLANPIIRSVREECRLEDPGNGIVLVLSIDKVAGLSKQIKKIRENLTNENL